MSSKSQLILPPKALASCIAGCILRDTRDAQLSDEDRVNYFPASPLYSATITFAGQIHIADRILSLDELRQRPAIPQTLFQPPKQTPQMSWSPAAIHAVTIAFFPDAWQRLGGSLDASPPPAIHDALSVLHASSDSIPWAQFWQHMTTLWSRKPASRHAPDWIGSDRVKDWANHLMGHLAYSGPGRSLRSAQRRLLNWTGLNKQTLEFFSKLEDVHRLIATDPETAPAEIAVEAGFSDQSHMGRALKRATGFSPVTLNHKIATEEPFWCYRLLGERF